MEYVLLYNPLAGNGKGARRAQALEILKYGDITESVDLTTVDDYGSFFAERKGKGFILCGGDGTLHRFANDTKDIPLPEEILYCAAGSGNDFLRDIEKGENDLIPLAPYLQDLPLCVVRHEIRRVINGVGYGIDGYCCQEGDRIRDLTDAPVDYAKIAIGGVLRHFDPVTATIIVDGKLHRFRKVWLASSMKGRYYGGGMMAAPQQDRFDPEGKLSLFVFSGSNRWQTLCIFPKIFSGEHVKSDACTVIMGSDITVLFDRPTPLQIDGEVFRDVTEYRIVARESLLAQEEAVG